MSTILITGANRGIGLEFARQYLAAGSRVIAGCRAPASAAELGTLALGSNGSATVHALDVEDHGSIERLAAELASSPIDVLINNAGSAGNRSAGQSEQPTHGFGQSNYDDWLTMFRVNVMGPMKMAEAFAPHLAAGRGKSIVTLSSVLGSMSENTWGGLYAYRATKAGANAVMKSMAVDLAGQGITAVAIHPGWVRTDMGGPGATLDVESSVLGMRAVIARLTPEQLGRFLTHEGAELPW
jgi:NAD(P)-dependent dehydrogenase (short-subunit alcohol dehydrogenase family)